MTTYLKVKGEHFTNVGYNEMGITFGELSKYVGEHETKHTQECSHLI